MTVPTLFWAVGELAKRASPHHINSAGQSVVQFPMLAWLQLLAVYNAEQKIRLERDAGMSAAFANVRKAEQPGEHECDCERGQP